MSALWIAHVTVTITRRPVMVDAALAGPAIANTAAVSSPVAVASFPALEAELGPQCCGAFSVP